MSPKIIRTRIRTIEGRLGWLCVPTRKEGLHAYALDDNIEPSTGLRLRTYDSREVVALYEAQFPAGKDPLIYPLDGI